MFLETELEVNETLVARLSQLQALLGHLRSLPTVLLLIVEAGSQPIGLWRAWRIREVK